MTNGLNISFCSNNAATSFDYSWFQNDFSTVAFIREKQTFRISSFISWMSLSKGQS